MMNALMLFIHVGCKFQHILIYQLEWPSNFLDFLDVFPVFLKLNLIFGSF